MDKRGVEATLLQEAESFLSEMTPEPRERSYSKDTHDSRRDRADGYDTEVEERRREERYAADLQKAYYDRLRRWDAHEVARNRKIQRDTERAANVQQEAEVMEKYLREYDDDLEMGRDDFYRDRDRWRARRANFLKREEAMDADDRELEKTRPFEEEKEEVKEEPAVVEQEVTSRIMTKEEREARIKELVSRIPIEKADLYAWPVKWNFVDEVAFICIYYQQF